MHLLIKINFKKFVLFSLVPLTICLLLAKNATELLVIAGIYFATIFNQWMLAIAVRKMVLSAHPSFNANGNKWTIILLFVLKFMVVFVSISFGVHFMGNRIIIPILNYVSQIFALSACLVFKKND